MQREAKVVNESMILIPNSEVSFVHRNPNNIKEGVPGGCAILPSFITRANSAASSNINDLELVREKHINGIKKDSIRNGISFFEKLLFI